MHRHKINARNVKMVQPESNKDGIGIPSVLMHTLGHLATAHCIISISVSCQNGGIVKLTNQVFLFLIIGMMTTLLLSFGLVHDQRRSKFSDNLGRQSEVIFSGCQLSWANLLFNLIQFSFIWPDSLQYQQESSGFREPSVP